MKIKTIFALLVILILSVGTVYAAPPGNSYSELLVQSGGKVKLDCTVIMPWDSSPGNDRILIIRWT